MSGKGQAALLPALLLLCLPGLLQAQQGREFSIGEARDLDSNELLYRERHCDSEDGLAREVFYRNPEGSLLAYKTIDYRSGAGTPSFVQHNLQQGGEISVSLTDGVISLSARSAGNPAGAKTYTTRVLEDLPLVIDAGFDAFIREHWQDLVAAKTRRFQFPVPDRASLVTLQIKPVSCSFETSSEQCFRLEMSNWLFRMLVAPIELAYDRTRQRLSRYRGLSNIEDEKGSGLIVDIRYQYPSGQGEICESPPSLATVPAIANPQ